MMEGIGKRRLGRWSIFVALLLIGTNLVTYCFVSGRLDRAVAGEEPTTVIKYQPVRQDVEPDTAIFFEALDSITENYYSPVDRSLLIEGAVRGMIGSIGDPQLRFYTPEDLDSFIQEDRGSYGGIGVRIIESGQYIVVFETFPGSPAEQVGLSAGDRILEAGGHELTGQGSALAAEILRGPEGSAVDVVIKRPGADEPIEIKVVRDEIIVKSVFSEILAPGVGYIWISNFDSNAASEFTEQLEALEEEGIEKGLILNLRNNPGGRVEQAVEVARMLVPEGEIVRIAGRDESVERIFYSSAERKPYPIVVLINDNSASASELLAGALSDNKAALLVGNQTYGKDSVQQLQFLSGGNAIMLTVGRYFTPSGRDIFEEGIKPDYNVEMPEILQYYRYFQPGSLEPGDYGIHVEMLQEILDLIGYDLEISGYYDESTSSALAEFQRSAGLENTGSFDDLTWVELREAIDTAAREMDEQLNFALELLDQPGLSNAIGGIE